MTPQDLARVHAIVRRFVPRHFDTEQIAVDVLVESWANGVEIPTYVFIRNRCFDVLRSSQVEQRVMSAQRPEDSVGPQTDTETNDLVGYFMGVLDNLERRVVYLKFFADKPLAEIASALRRDPKDIREVLAVALYKMKQEIHHD